MPTRISTNTLRYENSKIYKIWSHKGDKIFIDSTTKEYLSQRMTAHRLKYNQWKEGKSNKEISFDLFDEYGVENCQISLIEEFPCSSKDQLRVRKEFHVGLIPCVNKCTLICDDIKLCPCGVYFKEGKGDKYIKSRYMHIKSISHIKFMELHEHTD